MTDTVPVIVDTFSRTSLEIILLDLTMWVSFGDLIKTHFHGEASVTWCVECEETIAPERPNSRVEVWDRKAILFILCYFVLV